MATGTISTPAKLLNKNRKKGLDKSPFICYNKDTKGKGIKPMKRINKTTARKLYNEHKDFWITACNMRPECGILIGSSSFERMTETPFDTMVNSFTYYNCDNERGRYPAYYIED